MKEREERKLKRLLEERGLPLECEFTPANDGDVDAAEEGGPVETNATGWIEHAKHAFEEDD